MTPRTSLVAVWYSRLSVSSLVRVFGLEKTPVLDGDDGLTGKGCHKLHLTLAVGDLRLATMMAPIGSPRLIRGTPIIERQPPARAIEGGWWDP